MAKLAAVIVFSVLIFSACSDNTVNETGEPDSMNFSGSYSIVCNDFSCSAEVNTDELKTEIKLLSPETVNGFSVSFYNGEYVNEFNGVTVIHSVQNKNESSVPVKIFSVIDNLMQQNGNGQYYQKDGNWVLETDSASAVLTADGTVVLFKSNDGKLTAEKI